MTWHYVALDLSPLTVYLMKSRCPECGMRMYFRIQMHLEADGFFTVR